MSNNKSFLESLPCTATAYGDRFGISVQYGGNTPCTNGETIVLPDVGDEMNPEHVLAWLVHECGHVRYTRFASMNDLDTDFERNLFNALEDPRVEKALLSTFLGSRYVLNRYYEGTVKEMTDKARRFRKSKIRPAVLVGYLLAKGEHVMFGEKFFDELVQVLGKQVSDTFGSDVLGWLDEAALNLPNCKCSNDCVKATKELVRKLRTKLQQPSGGKQPSNQTQSSPSPGKGDGNEAQGGSGDAQSQSGQSQGGEPSKDGESSKDGKSTESNGSDRSSPQDAQQNASSQSGNPSDNGGSNDSNVSGGSSAQESGSSSEQDRQEGSSPEKENNPNEAIEKALNASKRDFEELGGLGESLSKQLARKAIEAKRNNTQVYPRPIRLDFNASRGEISRRDVERQLRGNVDPENPTIDYDLGIRRIQDARIYCRELSRCLRSFIESEERRREWTSRSGMRLSNSHLARLATFNTRVFVKQSEKKGIDTAVHILADFSGSMRNHCGALRSSDIAMNASLALLQTLKTIQNVNPAFSVFPNDATWNPVKNVVPHRSKGLAFYASDIGQVTAKGNTPLAEALTVVGYMLGKEKAQRRVVFVITDGVPQDVDAAARIVEQFEESGISVYGIVIGSCGIDEIFRKSRVINSTEELPKVMFDWAKELLVEGLRPRH